MGRVRRGVAGFPVVLAMGLMLVPAPGTAQSLDQVESLMAQGRFQDARTTLLAWSDAEADPSRSDRQRALWLRGLLTLDSGQAAVIYRQLVLEYPGGTFTDQALLRLGLSAASQGDMEEAAANFTILERDYPSSPAREQAVAWLRENGSALRSAGPERVPPRSDEEPAPVPAAGAASLVGDFTVQAGAFSELDRALALVRELRAAGFEPRMVQLPESDLFRVRLGRFRAREGAGDLVERLHGRGFAAGVATGARRERPAG
jgi:hypothetical protein